MSKVLIISSPFFNYQISVGDAFKKLGYDVKIETYDEPIHPFKGLLKWRHKFAIDKESLREKSRQKYKQYIEKQFDTSYIDSIIDDAVARTMNGEFDVTPKVNLVNALENNFKNTLQDFPEDRQNVLLVREDCYLNILNKLGQSFNFEFRRCEEMDLYKFTKRYSDKIISPFGVVFETTDKCVSYLKGMIDMKKSQRKQEKKLMLKAKKECNKVAEVFHNNNQSTIKVLMNSIAGGMVCWPPQPEIL